jgi:heptosyltransferase-2
VNKYKILIIAPNWVGDIVMSQTLFKMLKDKYQNNLILDILANDWTEDILKRMPEINNIIISPFKHGKLALIKRIKFGIQLKKNRYDQVFILTNSFKSAIIPFFANIKKRTGFIGEFRYFLINDIYKLDKIKLPRLVDRFCYLMNQGQNKINIPSLIIDQNNQQILLEKYNLKDKNLIIFAPGAEYGPAKRWPINNFIDLATLLIEKNYYIIILGSKKDKKFADEITQKVNNINILDLTGSTKLSDTVDIISLAKYTITNDSGLMHIAAATKTKTLAIYGSSSPNYTPPLSKNANIIKIDIECSPCFSRTCKFKHYNCLNFISSEFIMQYIH